MVRSRRKQYYEHVREVLILSNWTYGSIYIFGISEGQQVGVLILSNWTYGSIGARIDGNSLLTAVLILSNWTYGSILRVVL